MPSNHEIGVSWSEIVEAESCTVRNKKVFREKRFECSSKPFRARMFTCFLVDAQKNKATTKKLCVFSIGRTSPSLYSSTQKEKYLEEYLDFNSIVPRFESKFKSCRYNNFLSSMYRQDQFDQISSTTTSAIVWFCIQVRSEREPRRIKWYSTTCELRWYNKHVPVCISFPYSSSQKKWAP